MDRKKFNKELKSSNSNNTNNKCYLCEKGQNHSINSINKANNRYSDLNSNIKIHDPIFFFNKSVIENLLNLNSLNGNELISPCSCEKKFHKNCILLSVLHSNNILCQSCLNIYNIKSTEKLGIWSLIFSKRYYHSFIFHAILIALISIAIYFIADYKLKNPELYSAMKILLTIILISFNFLSIVIFINNLIKVQKNTPPLNIHIESKENMLSKLEMSNIHNIISENQNSNQNLISNNINNLSVLNKIDKNNNLKNSELKSKKLSNSEQKSKQINGLLLSQLNSIKNFVDYNEFFFNVFCIEIFESKLNFINRNKLIENKLTEHFNTIKELNDDEFQHNILIKYMDFNSSSESLDDLENYERRKFSNRPSVINISNKRASNNNDKKIKSNKIASLETPISREDFENESDNEAYYRKLNGMIPDSPINNALGFNKKLKNIFTMERENSENLNTNINSVSIEKLKFSHKDLTGLNISNIRHENKENVNFNNYMNNNEEKLILKENNFSGSNVRKPSNSNLIRNPTDSFKVRSKASNKDLNSNDSMVSHKFYKGENTEGIDYREFIVTEEKDFTNNSNFKNNIPRQKQSSEKIGFSRKDSKVPGAVFGEFKSFRPRNSASTSDNNYKSKKETNLLSEKLNPNSNINIYSNPQPIPIASNKDKISRRYSSFSPIITKMISAPPSSSTMACDSRKPQIPKNTGEFGMNIFSSNVIKNSSLEKSIVKKSSMNINLNLKNNSNFDYNRPLVKNKSISDSFYNMSWKKSKWSENNSVLYNSAKSKFNLINEEFGYRRKKTSESNNNSNINASSFKRKLLTISPNKRKLSSKEFSETNIAARLRQSVIFNLDNDENEYINKKIENLRSTIISQSLIGVNRNIYNKINQDNFIKSDSNLSAEVKNFASINDESLNNNNIAINSSIIYTNSSISSKIRDDKNNYLMKTCFMKETELNTINEECEIAVNKNQKNSKLIAGYESEFIDEIKEKDKYEKNKLIISSELNKFVDYPREKENTNFFNFHNNNGESHSSHFKEKEQVQSHYENFKTIRNIKNHLMDNKDNIIAEDASVDSYSQSSDSSEDEDSINSKSRNDSKKTIPLDNTFNRQIGKESKTAMSQSDVKPKTQDIEEDASVISKSKINSIVPNKKLEKRFSLEALNDKEKDEIQFKNKNNNFNSISVVNIKPKDEKDLELIDISDINDNEDYNAFENESKNKDSNSIPNNNFINDAANSSLINGTLSELNNKDYSVKESNNSSFEDYALKSKPNEQVSKFSELKPIEDKSDKGHEDHYDQDDLNLENLILVNSSEDESEDDNT